MRPRVGAPPGAYYGPCGDVYISGTYDTPLTIAAANDMIVTGNLTDATEPTRAATRRARPLLGLVANYYVRV